MTDNPFIVKTELFGAAITISASKIEDAQPSIYRLGRRNGELVLQGAFFWSCGIESGHEWRDIPIVDLDGEQ